MAILAGIDEAGFGPLLGPLVVSSAAFSVEPALLGGGLVADARQERGQVPQAPGGPAADRRQQEGLQPQRRAGPSGTHVAGRAGVPGQEAGRSGRTADAVVPGLPAPPGGVSLVSGLAAVPAGGRDRAIRRSPRRYSRRTCRPMGRRWCVCGPAASTSPTSTGWSTRVRNKAQVLFIAVTQLIQAPPGRVSPRGHPYPDRQAGRAVPLSRESAAELPRHGTGDRAGRRRMQRL